MPSMMRQVFRCSPRALRASWFPDMLTPNRTQAAHYGTYQNIVVALSTSATTPTMPRVSALGPYESTVRSIGTFFQQAAGSGLQSAPNLSAQRRAGVQAQCRPGGTHSAPGAG